MKRLFNSVVLFLCCAATTFAQFSGSGSGTESDPYLILNPIQLNQIRNFANQGEVYFKLMADIDLTDFIEDEYPNGGGWLPIPSFNGVLDGNGKIISCLWIDRASSNNIGLFAKVSRGTIKNLTLKNVNVKGKENVGALVGTVTYGLTIDNCYVEGNIVGENSVGGFAGSCDYQKCVNFENLTGKVNVTATGNNVGGVFGAYSDGGGTFNNCKIFNSSICGVDCVGGLTGCNSYSISNSSFEGIVSGHSYVGGLTGRGRCDISLSYVYGDIQASGDNVGGIVGYCYGHKHSQNWQTDILYINNCQFYGNLHGENYIGGIAGLYSSGGNYIKTGIKSCFVNANLSGDNYVGGICGSILERSQWGYVYLQNNVAASKKITAKGENLSAVTDNRTTPFVGLVFSYNGRNSENLAISGNKHYNRAIILSQGIAIDVEENEKNGMGVSATTLKQKATYVAMDWDFTNSWEIQETECFPYFKTQTAPPVITSDVVSGTTIISGKCVNGSTVTLDIDGVKQQKVSSGHEFSFTVSPLQAGHEVRISAKAEGKDQSYYTTETVAYLGSGKENDPYQVYTASDLTGVYLKGYFKLMNDIDLTDYINQFSSTEGWESIGRKGSETIHFDGNGHKITGLWCNSTRANTGLFSCFANGSIKNLTVEVASGKQVKGGANTGILIGKMINGTIENCKVTGKVADGTPVGGMVGLMDGGKISLCQANVTINTTGNTSYVGGLVGEITGGEIDQCVTLGALTATGTSSYVGGMVGKNYATVTNCYSNANVTSSYNAAGLIAYNYGLVEKCYATGNLSSNNYAAGVIGYNDGENAVIKNCAAMNNKIDLTFESQSAQSGGYGQRIIGGIKNGAPAPELNNYALKTMQVSVNNVSQKVYDDIMNGVGKTGADLTKASSYQELGWNFTNTWTIVEGESYPSLKNNAANVMKPGEDPNPNPDPEPVVTDKDKLEVGNVTASKGNTTSIGINLINESTDLTAYQFDLVLPTGITLATNDKGKYQVTKTSRYDDDSQTLNVSNVEGSDNTYRIVCFSMSNDKITGTSGAILNAVLTIDANIVDGTYEGKITNIVFTKTDGAQEKLNDAKFNIVVSSVILGDTNGDGEVNVSDIVEIVNYIMGKPSSKFIFAAADFNNDGEVNVTDIVKVVSVIMSTNSAPMRASAFETDNNDQFTMTTNSEKTFSLCLDNDAQYVAAQFDIKLAKGMTLESISMNGERQDNHLMTYARTGDNLYKVVVYSSENRPFKGNSGELLSFKVTGTGNVEVSNVLFVTSGETETTFPALLGGTTGIDNVKTSETMDVYSIDGRLVRKHVVNTDGLEKGLYIINGKKHIVR